MRNWMKKHSILLSLLLVLAVMVMIYCFSAQTGEESGALSGRLTRWVVGLVVPGLEDMDPVARENLLNTVGLIVRKLGHFTEFALLGFSLMLHICQLQKKWSVRLPLWWAWGIGALYAASDEFHQSFVGGRGPSVWDVMIDSGGVIAGVLLMVLILQNGKNPAIIKKNGKKDEKI